MRASAEDEWVLLDKTTFSATNPFKPKGTASAKLFTAYLQGSFMKLNYEKADLLINAVYLSHLGFAGDIVSLNELRQGLQEMRTELYLRKLAAV